MARTDPGGFIFDPMGNAAPTYEELQQRKKIASALMQRQGKVPKTVGEGLTEIGNAIGDIGYSWRVKQQEKEAAAAIAKLTGNPPPEGIPNEVVPYVSEDGKVVSPVASAPRGPTAPGPVSEAEPIDPVAPTSRSVLATPPPNPLQEAAANPAPSTNTVASGESSPAVVAAAEAILGRGAALDPAALVDRQPINVDDYRDQVPQVGQSRYPQSSQPAMARLPQWYGDQTEAYSHLQPKGNSQFPAVGGPPPAVAAAPPPPAPSPPPAVAAAAAPQPPQPPSPSSRLMSYGITERDPATLDTRAGSLQAENAPWFGEQTGVYAKMRPPPAEPVPPPQGTRLEIAGGVREPGPELPPWPREAPAARAPMSGLSAEAPPIPGPEQAAEARLNDVVGMSRYSDRNAQTGATASLGRAGDVMNDADPSPLGAGVAETVQQRREMLRNGVTDTIMRQEVPPTENPTPGSQRSQTNTPPSTAVGSQPDQRLAQANVFPNPTVAADGRPAAIIPGGGFPQPAPAPTAAAPKPAAPIAKAPAGDAIPAVPPVGERPKPPKLMSDETPHIKFWDGIAGNPYVDPATRQKAKDDADRARTKIKGINDQTIAEYNLSLKQWMEQKAKREDPASIYAVEKARQDLQADVPRPLTPEERKSFGIAEGQAAAMTRKGVIQYGPAGTKVEVNTGEKAAEKGMESLMKKVGDQMATHLEEGQSAADSLTAIRSLRESGVQTGGAAAMVNFLAGYGIKLPGSDRIEFYSSMIDRLAPQQRPVGAGGTSDFDAKGYKNSLFSLMRTPEGNEMILRHMEDLATNKLDRAKVARAVATGKMTMADGVDALDKLYDAARSKSDEAAQAAKAQREAAKTAQPKNDDERALQYIDLHPNDPDAPAARERLRKKGLFK